MSKKIVLITGASGDIGRAIYHQIDKKKYRCILHIRNKQTSPYRHVSKEDILIADFSDVNNVKNIFKKRNISLDILINTVGNYEAKSFLYSSFDEIHKQLSINFLSTLFLIHYYVKKMKKENRGQIINLSSGSGIHGGILPSFGYALSKNALNYMTTILAKELEPYNIKINTVVLRFIQTKMYNKFKIQYKMIKRKEFTSELPIYLPDVVANKVIALIDNDTVRNGDIIELL